MKLFNKKQKKLALKNYSTGEKESRIIKKENKKLWVSLGLASVTIISIFIIGVLVSIYKNLSSINLYLGISVTSLLVLLLLIFIIIPIVKTLTTPSFVLDATNLEEKITSKNYRTMKGVAKNLIKAENAIPFEEKDKLKDSMSNRYKLRDQLNVCYDKYIKKDIKKVIFSSSIKVACSTGLSQNNVFDALATIICNIRMIMQIVVKCGYRPSYIKLSKLIFKVFRNALIAYGIQSLNLGETVVSLFEKIFSTIPALGKPIASILEGATNGFFTARIGTITKKYLYAEFKAQSKLLTEEEAEAKILDEATEEAANLLKEAGEDLAANPA